jgi:hypothetical protein
VQSSACIAASADWCLIGDGDRPVVSQQSPASPKYFTIYSKYAPNIPVCINTSKRSAKIGYQLSSRSPRSSTIDHPRAIYAVPMGAYRVGEWPGCCFESPGMLQKTSALLDRLHPRTTTPTTGHEEQTGLTPHQPPGSLSIIESE